MAGAGGFEPPHGGIKSLSYSAKNNVLAASIAATPRLAVKCLRALCQTARAGRDGFGTGPHKNLISSVISRAQRARPQPGARKDPGKASLQIQARRQPYRQAPL